MSWNFDDDCDDSGCAVCEQTSIHAQLETLNMLTVFFFDAKSVKVRTYQERIMKRGYVVF